MNLKIKNPHPLQGAGNAGGGVTRQHSYVVPKDMNSMPQRHLQVNRKMKIYALANGEGAAFSQKTFKYDILF